ncbi:MAG: hypothetical protein LBF56_00005, partial [Holosporales bacterium]|nr:hypothetical protein [Holosporales bacterium]
KNDYVREAYQKYEKNTREKASKTSGVEQNSTLRFIQALVDPTYKWEPECDRALVLMYIYGYGAHFGIKYTSAVPQEWQVVNKQVPVTIYQGLPYNPKAFLELATTSHKTKNGLATSQASNLVDQIRSYATSDELKKSIEHALEDAGKQHRIYTSTTDQGNIKRRHSHLIRVQLGLETPEEYHLDEQFDNYACNFTIPSGHFWEWQAQPEAEEDQYGQIIFPTRSEPEDREQKPQIDDHYADGLKSLSNATDEHSNLLRHRMHCINLFSLGAYLRYIGLIYRDDKFEPTEIGEFMRKIKLDMQPSYMLGNALQCMALYDNRQIARSLLSTLNIFINRNESLLTPKGDQIDRRMEYYTRALNGAGGETLVAIPSEAPAHPRISGEWETSEDSITPTEDSASDISADDNEKTHQAQLTQIIEQEQQALDNIVQQYQTTQIQEKIAKNEKQTLPDETERNNYSCTTPERSTQYLTDIKNQTTTSEAQEKEKESETAEEELSTKDDEKAKAFDEQPTNTAVRSSGAALTNASSIHQQNNTWLQWLFKCTLKMGSLLWARLQKKFI